MNLLRGAVVSVLIVTGLCYPFLIYWGIQRFEPKFIGLVVASLYFLRLFNTAKKFVLKCLSALAVAVFALALWFINDEALLMILPAIISFGGLIIFAYSLIQPPTIPAQFALRQGDALCPQRLHYTNILTVIWMSFFASNMAIALYTAFYCTRELWALYNGLISYILIGSLFLGEYLYRRFIFERRLQHD